MFPYNSFLILIGAILPIFLFPLFLLELRKMVVSKLERSIWEDCLYFYILGRIDDEKPNVSRLDIRSGAVAELTLVNSLRNQTVLLLIVQRAPQPLK